MLTITSGKVKRPILMAIYGVESSGKTEFCTKFPDPLFIDYEGGSERYDVKRVRPKGYFEVKEFLSDIRNLEGHKTLVIDSMDWLERAMHKDMCARAKVDTIQDLGAYGKWVNVVLGEANSFIDLLKEIREKTNINIVLTAHYKIKSFSDPITQAPYDRYMMKLDEKFSDVIREWVDMVLFANFETYSKTNSSQDKKGKGVGTGMRLIFTEKRPAHDAKNRFNLPYQMPLDYDVLMNHVDSAKEDQIRDLCQDIDALILDVKDADLLPKIKDHYEKNKTNIDSLRGIKNRLLVINNG